jgi:hypothetical protein
VFVLNGLVAAGPITHMALMAESPPVIHHLIGALVLFCCFAFPFCFGNMARFFTDSLPPPPMNPLAHLSMFHFPRTHIS